MAEDERKDEAAEQSETVDEQPAAAAEPTEGPGTEDSGTEQAGEDAGNEQPGTDDDAQAAAPADESAEVAEQAAEAAPAEPSETTEAETTESAEAETTESADSTEDQESAEAAPPAQGKKREEKKAEAIPGADLEPIAVDSEEQLSAEERARREADEEERARREAALTSDTDDEPQIKTRAPARLEGDARFLATGKRKRSIARVILLPGSGKIEVNRRPLEEFFPRPLHQTMARQPLTITGYDSNVDVRIRVNGGGVSGQAGAVRHGIAKALTEIDPELRGELKRRGFLTRDARVKERRKAGLKKARKRPQFSKR